ncbi:UNVERIFIED_CONTAM: hypothetical protein RMT77_012822 [Armadillidium vulgare]
MIYSSINNFISSIFRPKLPTPTVPKLDIFLKTPYLGSLTPILNKQIHSLLQRHFPQINPHLVGVNSFSIKSLFTYKDALPSLLRSSVVYLFKCSGCNSCYVGQTGLQLQLRIHKHLGTSFRTQFPFSSPETSAIRNHAHSLDHPFHSSNFSILSSNSNDIDRKILESLFIKRLQPDLNSSSSSFPLLIS